jgi:hypothetical protein
MENRAHVESEYSELGSAIRHYSALRFAMLTIFFALIGGLMTFAFDHAQTSGFVTVATKIGGVLVTFVFWVFEYRVSAYMACFDQRAFELEQKLGYAIYSARQKSQPWLGIFSTPRASRILFAACSVFWIISFFV